MSDSKRYRVTCVLFKDLENTLNEAATNGYKLIHLIPGEGHPAMVCVVLEKENVKK